MQEQLTFSWLEPHASPFQLQDSGKDLKTHAEISCLLTLRLLHVCGLDGLSGKTSPVSCHQTEDGILVPSLAGWGSWGMGSRTECWTLNGAEHTGTQEPCRNAEGVCSLSDVLETQQVPQRFYLSEKACQGILRRAERRGKELPPMSFIVESRSRK